MSDYPTNPNLKETQAQVFEWLVQSTVESSMERFQEMEKLLIKNGWDENEVYKINYAFHELLVNAIVHGNLGLKKPKNGKDQDFAIEIAEAERLPENQAKKVMVKIVFEPQKLTIEIQDEGKNTPEFWKTEAEGMRTGTDTAWQSGRGIEISEKFMDEVRFEKNGTGIKVVITKNKEIA